MKEKNFRKKLVRRKTADDLNISDSEEIKIELGNTIINSSLQNNNNNLSSLSSSLNNNIISSEKTYKLDFGMGNYNLEGIKGHLNYYSLNPIQSGTFYFEVKINSLDFNVNEWINQKRIDEFSKKYYENIITKPKLFSPNIRIGISHNKCDLEIPVGSDQNSYCYRLKDGALISEGDIKGHNISCENGDVIGVLIKMKPPMPEFLKAKMLEYEEQISVNNECYIKFYVNGIEQQNNFIGLHEGEYHLVITLYNFAQAEIDFGNNLKFFNSISQTSNVILLKECR